MIKKCSLGLLIVLVSSCAVTNKSPKSNPEASQQLETDYKNSFSDLVGIEMDKLGSKGGFFNNDSVSISIPAASQRIEDALRGIQLGEYPDKVIASMNRVAEIASSKVRPILLNDINALSSIEIEKMEHSQENNPATSYLRTKYESQIEAFVTPKIKVLMQSEGVLGSWEKMYEKYNQIPFIITKDTPDITTYLSQVTVDGIFKTVAVAESKQKK